MKKLKNNLGKIFTGLLFASLLTIPISVSAGECDNDPGGNNGLCIEDMYENEFCSNPDYSWWEKFTGQDNYDCVQGDVEGDGDELPGTSG